MTRFRVASDIEECRALWLKFSPRELVSDLWEVRDCFHRHFNNRPHFIVAEDEGGAVGLLPLSWIEESGCHGYFPGETWHGKTWLEQNRVFADDAILPGLLAQIPPARHVRYMLSRPCPETARQIHDETGYLFLPPQYDYDMENYYREFSRKSVKRMEREMGELEARGVSYRHDNPEDFELIVDLNIGRFGQDSYFHDNRFADSFRALMDFLAAGGMMRITTVLIEGTPAAVDLGCVYRGNYTMLAGGTHAGYPGVAKLINLHHMKYACEQKLLSVDFLCGDFSWKKLFHLAERPLYMISDRPGLAPAPPCSSPVAKSATIPTGARGTTPLRLPQK